MKKNKNKNPRVNERQWDTECERNRIGGGDERIKTSRGSEIEARQNRRHSEGRNKTE